MNLVLTKVPPPLPSLHRNDSVMTPCQPKLLKNSLGKIERRNYSWLIKLVGKQVDRRTVMFGNKTASINPSAKKKKKKR